MNPSTSFCLEKMSYRLSFMLIAAGVLGMKDLLELKTN